MLKRIAGIIVALLALAAPVLAQTPFVRVSQSVTLSVSSVSSTVAVGTSTRIATLWICNTGTVAAYIFFGDSTVVADTTGTIVPGGLCGNISPDGKTNIAAVTASSTTTLVITPGAGVLFGAGGGGGGGGGGASTITAPTFGGSVGLTISNSTGRIAFPANTTTYPAVVLTPDLAQGDVYIALGDNTVTAAVTAAACAQGVSTFCSQNIALTPVCYNINGATNVAVISPSSGGVLRVAQYTSCPTVGAPAGTYQNLSPFGDYIVNVNSWNGTVPATGPGTGTAGSPRFTASNDSQIQIWDGINGSMTVKPSSTLPSATDKAGVVTLRDPVVISYADPCSDPTKLKSSAPINITTATTTVLVALSGSTTVHVCGASFTIAPSATAADTVAFEYGTGATCGTGTTLLTGSYGNGDLTSAAAVVPINFGFAQQRVFAGAASNAVCALTTGTAVNVQGFISYWQG